MLNEHSLRREGIGGGVSKLHLEPPLRNDAVNGGGPRGGNPSWGSGGPPPSSSQATSMEASSESELPTPPRARREIR